MGKRTSGRRTGSRRSDFLTNPAFSRACTVHCGSGNGRAAAKIRIIAALFLASLAIPALAQEDAQEDAERGWIAGVELVSNYVAAGVSQSGGNPSTRGYAAFRRKGFYGGLSLAHVELGPDRTELDLYAGFAKRFDNRLLVDASYVHYFFDETGSCCSDFRVKATYPIRENFGVQGFVAYSHEFQSFNRRATVVYAFSPGLGLSATYGRSDRNQNEYWDIGSSFAMTDNLSLDLRYYGATSGDEGLVLRFSAATAQTAIVRLLLSPFQR